MILELHIPIEQILAVTYTVAATEELRDRVRNRLRNALDNLLLGKSDDEIVGKYLKNGRKEQGIRDLDLAVQNFDDTRIFTIHGFCQRVLRDYAFESGILFDMELLTDPTPLFEEVAQDFWRQQFYRGPSLLATTGNRGSPIAHYLDRSASADGQPSGRDDYSSSGAGIDRQDSQADRAKVRRDCGGMERKPRHPQPFT